MSRNPEQLPRNPGRGEHKIRVSTKAEPRGVTISWLPGLKDVSSQARAIEEGDRLVISRIPSEMLQVTVQGLPNLHSKLDKKSPNYLYLKDLTPEGLKVLLHILRSWRVAGGIQNDYDINDYFAELFPGARSFQRVVEVFGDLLCTLSKAEQGIIGHELYLVSVASGGPKPLVGMLEELEALEAKK